MFKKFVVPLFDRHPQNIGSINGRKVKNSLRLYSNECLFSQIVRFYRNITNIFDREWDDEMQCHAAPRF